MKRANSCSVAAAPPLPAALWQSVTDACGSGAETATPSRAVRPATRRLTAASRLASWAGPICWIGYQYWLHILVSPGWRKEKSGWLSVYTPAINSMYGPSLSVRFRSQA